jgi:hypothetical protein
VLQSLHNISKRTKILTMSCEMLGRGYIPSPLSFAFPKGDRLRLPLVCCVYTHPPFSHTSLHNSHAYTTQLQPSTSIKALSKPDIPSSNLHCMLCAVIRQATLHATLSNTIRSRDCRVSFTHIYTLTSNQLCSLPYFSSLQVALDLHGR